MRFFSSLSLSFQGWSLIPCEANQKTAIWRSSISPAQVIYYNPQMGRRWGQRWLCPGSASPLPCTPQGTLQKEVPGNRTQGLGEGTAPTSYSQLRAMKSGELNPGDSPQRSQAEQNHHCSSTTVPIFTEGSPDATDSMAMGMEWHRLPLQQPFEVRTATSNIFLARK